MILRAVGRLAGKQKTHRRFLAMGCKFRSLTVQPLIAKAQTLRGHHVARFGSG